MSKSLNISYRRLNTIADDNKDLRIDNKLFLYPVIILTEYYTIMWIFCKLFKLF